MSKKLMVIVILMGMVSLLSAQLQEKLESLVIENAKGYMQPFANALGAGINSGHYNTAKVLFPLTPNVRVGSSLVLIPAKDKLFKTTNDTETASIFGDKGVGLFPDGLNLSTLPITSASISLGLPLGNEIMVRGFPNMKLAGVGQLNFYGAGLKHSISQYLPLSEVMPVDIALQGVYQQLNVGDIVKMNTFTANLQASAKLLMITLYGGLGYENAKMDIEYQELGKTEKSKVSLEAANELKFTVGVRYTLLMLIDFFADYTIADTPSVNLGAGVGF